MGTANIRNKFGKSYLDVEAWGRQERAWPIASLKNGREEAAKLEEDSQRVENVRGVRAPRKQRAGQKTTSKQVVRTDGIRGG